MFRALCASPSRYEKSWQQPLEIRHTIENAGRAGVGQCRSRRGEVIAGRHYAERYYARTGGRANVIRRIAHHPRAAHAETLECESDRGRIGFACRVLHANNRAEQVRDLHALEEPACLFARAPRHDGEWKPPRQTREERACYDQSLALAESGRTGFAEVQALEARGHGLEVGLCATSSHETPCHDPVVRRVAGA